MNYKGFHQLQWEDRLVIEKMLKVGDSKAKIAEALGVCKKTIYNEIKRGWTQQMTSDYEFIWCYCPEMAERKYQENLRAKGPDLKIGNDIDFANYVEQKIVEEHYSPAALLAELKAKPPQFDTTVCEATLYNYIYRGDVFLVLNPEHLLICRTIKLNAGALGGHRRCCHAKMQKNAQNKPQIARLILCVHTTLQVYCNLFLTFCVAAPIIELHTKRLVV